MHLHDVYIWKKGTLSSVTIAIKLSVERKEHIIQAMKQRYLHIGDCAGLIRKDIANRRMESNEEITRMENLKGKCKRKTSNELVSEFFEEMSFRFALHSIFTLST